MGSNMTDQRRSTVSRQVGQEKWPTGNPFSATSQIKTRMATKFKADLTRDGGGDDKAKQNTIQQLNLF